MLALASTSLSYTAPALPSRVGLRAGVVRAQNEMEPDEGWNVDNLMTMMDDSEEAVGGPKVAEVFDRPVFDVKELPGATAPLGFWDPAGFSEGASEGKVRFYREVELKHGRVGMLAALGFLVGEQFHPLWGGEVDVPSYIAFQETPLQAFWPAVVLLISVVEVFSVFSFQNPATEEKWAIRLDHIPGDLGFDPLGLKPTKPAELLAMQNAEINNGRLGMIAAAGMIAQELATGKKLFEF